MSQAIYATQLLMLSNISIRPYFIGPFMSKKKRKKKKSIMDQSFLYFMHQTSITSTPTSFVLRETNFVLKETKLIIKDNNNNVLIQLILNYFIALSQTWVTLHRQGILDLIKTFSIFS